MVQQRQLKRLSCKPLTGVIKPLHQEGNRRLAVFRLGSLTGSLLTHSESYLEGCLICHYLFNNFFLFLKFTIRLCRDTQLVL
jgi:hypothetical protein